MSDILDKIESFAKQEKEALRDSPGAAAVMCRFFPMSLLAGLGLRPVRITGGMGEGANAVGERFVRPDACSFCKSVLGGFALGQGLAGSVKVVIGLYTCDMMRRTLERLALDLEVPVFPVQLPATRTENSRDYYVAQVVRVLADFSDHLGVEIDFSKVRDYAREREKTANLLGKAFETGDASPLAAFKMLRTFGYVRPEALSSFLCKEADSLKSNKKELKVVVAGSTVTEEDDTVFRVIEENGAGAVDWTCSGLKALFTEKADDSVPDEKLVERMAAQSFDQPVCARNRPNDDMYDDLRSVVEKTGARGVIFKTLKFCDLWFTEKERAVRELDVPVLVLDGSTADAEEERTTNRVESFLESLR